jgi:hypothetical protein
LLMPEREAARATEPLPEHKSVNAILYMSSQRGRDFGGSAGDLSHVRLQSIQG